MDTKTLRCGLLGRKLGHSYSPAIHERLADYSYRLFEVEPEDLGAFLQEGAFDGLNVTIPYKKDVIPYCAELSDTARAIGAVNTPLAMMIIGASLAHSDILAAVSNPRLYRVSLLRLILIPLLMMGLVSVLPIDRMLAGICVIVSAMPIASNCGMLCDVYTPQDMTASHAIIISTLMSAVTLPVIVVLMGVVGLA